VVGRYWYYLQIKQGTLRATLDRFQGCDLIVQPLNLGAKRLGFTEPGAVHSPATGIRPTGTRRHLCTQPLSGLYEYSELVRLEWHV